MHLWCFILIVEGDVGAYVENIGSFKTLYVEFEFFKTQNID